MLTRAPGASIRSPPIDIHPAWFDEKSAGAACCSAIAGALGIAQIRLARMPPARTPSLIVNAYMAVPPRVLFLLLNVIGACHAGSGLAAGKTGLSSPARTHFVRLPHMRACRKGTPPYPPPHVRASREGGDIDGRREVITSFRRAHLPTA